MTGVCLKLELMVVGGRSSLADKVAPMPMACIQLRSKFVQSTFKCCHSVTV